jgi:lysophospholipase L1-like esterase
MRSIHRRATVLVLGAIVISASLPVKAGQTKAQLEGRVRMLTDTEKSRWVRPGNYTKLEPERLKQRVSEFQKADMTQFPPPEAVLFVGSATIAGWDIPHYFPEYTTIKRGLGGSMTSETTYWADDLVIKYKPSTVVFYSGDNDAGEGMTADQIASDVAAFTAKIHAALPDTQIVIFSIRPSIARWPVHRVVFDANRRVQEFAASKPWIRFVDMTPLLLGPDGEPRPELLVDDLHHLNKAGFDLVTAKIKPAIAEAEKAYQAGRGGAGRR